MIYEVQLMFDVIFSALDQASTVLNQDLSLTLKNTRLQITQNMQNGYIINEKLKLMDGFSDYFKVKSSASLNIDELEPYVNFEDEPDVIIQIKKFINILYHIEIVVAEAEKHKNFNTAKYKPLKVSHTTKEIIHLWSDGTVDRAYKAIQLLLCLDFSFIELFAADYSSLYGLFTDLKTQKTHMPALFPALLTSIMDASFPSSYQLGSVAGTALKHMQPDTQKIDFNFITRFSAVLPGYIQEATAYINQCANDIATHEPTLNQANIKALEDNAIKLLTSIDTIKISSNALLALNFINYIHIIRHVMTLSKSTLQQIGTLSDTTQNTIRNNMMKVKENIALLAGIADKVENGLLLAPGTLSTPLNQKLDVFYQTLVHHVQKATSLGTLSTLNDLEFIEARLQETKLRINDGKQRIIKAEKNKEDLAHFFTYLEDITNDLNPKQKHIRLMDLNPENKEKLLNFYRSIQAYVQKFSESLDQEIIHDLTTTIRGLDQAGYFLTRVQEAVRETPSAVGTIASSAKSTFWSLTSKISKQIWQTDDKKASCNLIENTAETQPLNATKATVSEASDDKIDPLDDTTSSNFTNSSFEDTDSITAQAATEASALPTKPHTYQTFIPDLLSKKDILIKAIDSEINTQKMHILNNQSIIHYVRTTIPHLLCAYLKKEHNLNKNDPVKNKFNFHEELALKLCPSSIAKYTPLDPQPEFGAPITIMNKKTLNSTQLYYLHHYYHDQQIEMTTALGAYKEFKKILVSNANHIEKTETTLGNLSSNIKTILKNLYLTFQPWFVSALPQTAEIMDLDLDNTIIHGLMTEYDVEWMPNNNLNQESQFKKNTLYVEKVDHVFKYVVIDPFGIKKTGIINIKELQHKFKNPLTIEQLKSSLPKLLQTTLKNGHTHPDPEDSVINFADLDKIEKCFLQKLKLASNFCEKQEIRYKTFAEEKYPVEISRRNINKQNKPIYQIEHIIKDNQFSKKIKLYSETLHKQLGRYLSQSIMDNLELKSGETPFPEIENVGLLGLNDTPKSCHIIYTTPSNTDEKRVTSSEEILIIVHENTYQIGFNKNKKYSQILLTNNQLIAQITPYVEQKANYITTPELLYPLNKMAELLENEYAITPVSTNPQLTQIKQLTNIKRLFNLLYNLEKVFERLENSSSSYTSYTKITYLIPYIQAIIHTIFFINSLKELQRDPHLSFLTNGLITKFLTIREQIYTFTLPYADEPPVDSVMSPGIVKKNPLWYTLHGFMLIPEHIIAGYKRKSLTKKDLEEISIHTKRTELILERVIDKSDSYFKLLLETPAMYALFKELRKKLASFMKTIYSVGAEEQKQLLEKLNDEWFANILIRADQYESEWGLNSTLISNNLSKIFNEFYKGLLEPFELVSKRHLACITSKKAIDARMIANTNKQDESLDNLNRNTHKQEKLKLLVATMENYKTKQNDSSTQLNLNMIGANFRLHYDDAYPILASAMQILKINLNARVLIKEPTEADKINVLSLSELLIIHTDATFRVGFCTIKGEYAEKVIEDTTLLDYLTSYKAGQSIIKLEHINIILQHIEAANINNYFDTTKLFPEPTKKTNTTIASPTILDAAKKTLDYYDRLVFAYQLEHNAAIKKGQELEEGKTKQIDLNQHYKLDYIKTTFDKNLNLIIKQQLPPPCVQEDYSHQLQTYLLKVEKEICQNLETSLDINQAIHQAILAKIAKFETKHLADYQQLSAIIIALNQFNTLYATDAQKRIKSSPNESSLFENKTTLRKKTDCIQVLNQIINLPNLTPAEKIKLIKDKVDPNQSFSDKEPQTFKNIMLTYCQFDTVSWSLLQRWLISLFAAIHLYTPEPVRYYKQIETAVALSNTPQPTRRLINFFHSARQIPTTAPMAQGSNPAAIIEKANSNAINP